MDRVVEVKHQENVRNSIVSYIDELTQEAKMIIDEYRMMSLIRNGEERGINYLTGLLPVLVDAKVFTPSIVWVDRKYKVKGTGMPVEKHLRGVCKNNRTAPRRYTMQYLERYVTSDAEMEALEECEAKLDPIRRKIFFLGKAASLTNTVTKCGVNSDSEQKEAA